MADGLKSGGGAASVESPARIAFSGVAFWKNYMLGWFGDDLIVRCESLMERIEIDSVRGPIGLEVYRAKDPSAPTLVFSHGIAGYARLMLPFIVPLVDRGINVVAPDLEGYGYNGRVKGDFSWDEHLANLDDALAWAKRNFRGKVFLGGASMGGPLAYASDARYDRADGLVCWCLWDFADREFMEKETTTKGLTFVLLPFMRLFALLFGGLRVKTFRFVSYDTLTGSPEFNRLVKLDPQAGTLISLRGALSLVIRSRPDRPHGEYRKPVLVCQPEDDRMTPPRYTRKVFERLGARRKKFVSFPGEHFPLDGSVYRGWAEAAADFMRGSD